MTIEDKEYTAGSIESNDANTDFSDRFTIIESYLGSIRAASWVTAIGIVALAFFILVK